VSLTILAVDDEQPALDELEYLLSNSPAVDTVITATDATTALRELGRHAVDAIFLDINMPGLSGLELAEVLRNYTDPPPVVFVTAHEDRAVDAFAVGALDYLLKPIRDARLAEAIDRVAAAARTKRDPDEVIPVELGGVTSLVRRDSIGWVEAVGDYARLHSSSGDHLVRIPLSTLESRWSEAGFMRVHRSYLVSLPMVTGLRSRGTSTVVCVRANGRSPATDLPVSRRQLRDLKDRLIRDPMRNYRAQQNSSGDGR
jgi:two-component system response regulator LytT